MEIMETVRSRTGKRFSPLLIAVEILFWYLTALFIDPSIGDLIRGWTVARTVAYGFPPVVLRVPRSEI